MVVHLRQQVLPTLRILAAPVLLGLVTAVAFRWLAPSWWPAVAGAGFTLWVRSFGGVPWKQAAAIWIGQALALSATRGFHGFGQAVLFTSPLAVWALVLPLVPHGASHLWQQIHDRLPPSQRRWALVVLAVGLPAGLAVAGVRLGLGLTFAAFGVAAATTVTRSPSANSARLLWLATGCLVGLAVHLKIIGAFAALVFMPYEAALFLLPQVLGYVIWSTAGTDGSLASQPEGS